MNVRSSAPYFWLVHGDGLGAGQRCLIPASGLHEHEGDAQRLQRVAQRRMRGGTVVEPPWRKLRTHRAATPRVLQQRRRGEYGGAIGRGRCDRALRASHLSASRGDVRDVAGQRHRDGGRATSADSAVGRGRSVPCARLNEIKHHLPSFCRRASSYCDETRVNPMVMCV